MIRRKPKTAYNNNVKTIFNLISYNNNNPIVMGSNAFNLNDYGSDFDLFEVVYTNENAQAFEKEVIHKFKSMMEKIKQKPDVYFIDFKAGNTENGLGMHWTLENVLKGKQFSKIFEHKSIIKIDVVAYMNGLFTPFSNVFEFRYENGVGLNQVKETVDNIESLKADVDKYYKEKNYMKACKRMFTIAQVKKDKPLIQKLLKIFSSNCGKAYKIKSDIQTMIDMIEAKHFSKEIIKRMKDELQILKEKISNINEFYINKNIFNRFDKTSNKETVKKILSSMKLLRNLINTMAQEMTKELMRELKVNINI